jgi:hypothetical protein
MPRARSLAPLLGERGRAPFKPEANRFLGGGDVATIHPQQLLRIGARPDLVIWLQRRSLRVFMRGGLPLPVDMRRAPVTRGFEKGCVRIRPAMGN